MMKIKPGDLFVDGFCEILIWYADDDFVVWECNECFGFACHEYDATIMTRYLNKLNYRRITK